LGRKENREKTNNGDSRIPVAVPKVRKKKALMFQVYVPVLYRIALVGQRLSGNAYPKSVKAKCFYERKTGKGKQLELIDGWNL